MRILITSMYERYRFFLASMRSKHATLNNIMYDLVSIRFCNTEPYVCLLKDILCAVINYFIIINFNYEVGGGLINNYIIIATYKI